MQPGKGRRCSVHARFFLSDVHFIIIVRAATMPHASSWIGGAGTYKLSQCLVEPSVTPPPPSSTVFPPHV